MLKKRDKVAAEKKSHTYYQRNLGKPKLSGACLDPPRHRGI